MATPIAVQSGPATVTRPHLLPWILGLRWEWVFIFALVMGAALIGSSSSVGILNVRLSPDSLPARQVGYGAAINWSIGYLLLFPIATTLLVSVLCDVPKVIADLEAHGILSPGPSWTATDRPAVVLYDRWLAGTAVRRWTVLMLGIVFPIVISLKEWFFNNYLRLYHGRAIDEVADVDWGLACNYLTPACTWSTKLGNVLVDLFAFAAQALYLSALLVFLIYIVDLHRVLGDDRVQVMPAPLSSDDRRGFELFEPMLWKTLLAVLVGYLLAYAVRLESLYLRSDRRIYHSLADFVQGDVMGGIVAAAATDGGRGAVAGALGQALFDVGSWSNSSIWSVIGVFFEFFVAIVVMLSMVFGLAWKARANASRDPAARHLAEGMRIWPFGYPRLNNLAGWTAFALLSLVCYRIGLFIAGLSVGTLVFQAASTIGKAVGNSVNGPPAPANGE